MLWDPKNGISDFWCSRQRNAGETLALLAKQADISFSMVTNGSEEPHVSRHIFTFRAFGRCFCPKWLTVMHTYIYTLMAVSAMQGAEQHIRSSLGFSILPKHTSTCKPGKKNERPSDNKHSPNPSHSWPLHTTLCMEPPGRTQLLPVQPWTHMKITDRLVAIYRMVLAEYCSSGKL